MSFCIQIPFKHKRFEHENNISVNVYEYKDKKITTTNAARHHVNLLYITADEASHYVLAKDLSRLVSQQHNNSKHKKYFRQYCFYGCISEEVLKNHLHPANYMEHKESCFQNLTTRRRVTESSL